MKFLQIIILILFTIIKQMQQHKLDLLIKKQIVNPSDLQQWKKTFKSVQGTEEMLNKLLQVYQDGQSKKKILQAMCTDAKIRSQFVPYLQLLMINFHIAQIFGAEIDNPEYMEFIGQQVKEGYSDIKALIAQIYEGLLGQKISEDELQQTENSLRELANILLEQLKTYKEKGINNNSKQKSEEQQQQIVSKQKQQLEKLQKQMWRAEKKNCQEYIQELNEDMSDMPKNIIQYQLRKMQVCLTQQFIDNQKQPTQLPEEDKKYLESLEVSHSEAKKARQKLLQGGEDVRKNIRIFRNHVCCMDIHDLFRMIEKGKQLEEIRKQNLHGKKIKVILFLGLSKGGKTTILTRLMGYEMVKIRVEGITTIQPKYPQKMTTEHKQLVIGYLPRSTTRYPRLFQIPHQYLGEDDDGDEYVTYGMDCAGFEDTAGIQVQISNRITTIEALKKVDKLQIAVVINSKHWGATGENVEKLARTTSSIIRNYKQVKKSITFVFNQFDSQFRETFHANVSALYKEIINKGKSVSDQNYKQFFKQLKEQTKNPATMFVVDPIQLDPKEFMQKVSNDKVDIQNPFNCLISDIGGRPKEQVKKYCQMSKKQLKKYYDKRDMKAMQYYVKMLEKVGSQPKLESEADLQVMRIKKSIEDSLKERIKKLSIELRQLEKTTIRQKQHRQTKISDIYALKQSLQADIQQFQQLEKCNQLKPQIKQIISKIFEFFRNSVNKWAPQNYGQSQELYDNTVLGLDLYKQFGTQKDYQQLYTAIQDKMDSIQKSMQADLESLNENHEMGKNHEIITHLQKLFNKNCSLAVKIQQKLQNQIQNIQLINLHLKCENDPQTGLIGSCVISNCVNEKLQIQKIQKLLQFIKIIETYPKKMIENIYSKMKALKQNIIVTIPKKYMEQFSNSIKATSEQYQTDDYQQTIKPNQNIDQIKKLINSLKILDKISQVHEYYGNSLTQQFNSLESIVERQMIKFEKINAAFQQNDVKKIKNDIKKLRGEFKQLENMVLIAQNNQLVNRFQALKSNFQDSIRTFINDNDIVQTINLNNKNSLRNAFDKYKKIAQFSGVYKILDSSLSPSSHNKENALKDNVDRVLQNIRSAITSPITALSTQITQKKIFQVKKIGHYLNYMETLKNDGKYSLGPQLMKLIYTQDKKLREIVQTIYVQKIEQPLKCLRKMFDENNSFGDQQISEIQKYMISENINNCRKAFQLLWEMNENIEVSEFLFGDSDIWNPINTAFEQFGYSLKEKLQTKCFAINTLDRLKLATSQLKTILPRSGDQQLRQKYDEISDIIKQKMSKLASNDQQKKDSLINGGVEPFQFDAQLFVEVFTKVSEDKTETGKKHLYELQDHFKKYRKKVQNEIEKKTIEMIEQQDMGEKIPFMLQLISKHYLNIQIIHQKIQGELFKAFAKQQTKTKVMKNIGTKISNYFNHCCQSVKSLTKKEENQLINRLKSVDTEIQELKKAGFLMEQVEGLKKQKKIQFLSTAIVQSKKDKNKNVKRMKQGVKIPEDITDDFTMIYQSLDQKQQNQVYDGILKSISQKTKIMKTNYETNYDQYKKCKQVLKAVCLKMPKKIQKYIAEEIEKIQDELQSKISKQFEQIKNEKNLSMSQIIRIGKRFKSSKNTDKLECLNSLIGDKQMQIDNNTQIDVLLQTVEIGIWRERKEYQSLEVLLPSIQKFENKIIDRIKKKYEDIWKAINKTYNNIINSDDDSMDGAFSEYTANNKRNKQKLRCISSIYSVLKKAVDDKSIISEDGRKSCETIVLNIQEFLNTFQENAKQTINSFKKIQTDPVTHKQIVSDTLAIIQLYQRDFKNITMFKDEIFNNLFRGKFCQLNKQIKSIKINLENYVNPILSCQFDIFSNEVKNNSDQQDQTRIQAYEKQMKILKALETAYNSYISPYSQSKKKISIIEKKQEIEKQIKCYIQKYNTALNQFFESDVEEVIDPIINYIPRIMRRIKSKPRQFLVININLKQESDQILKNFIKTQVDKQDKIIQNLKSYDAKYNKDYDQYKNKEYHKLFEKKSNLNSKKDNAINKINNQYTNLHDKEQKKEEKDRIKKQWDCKVSQATNNCNKNTLAETQKYQQLLIDYMKKKQQQSRKHEQQFVKELMRLKKLGFIQEIKVEVDKKVDEVLKSISKNNKTVNLIFGNLSQSDCTVAAKIIDDHHIFNKMKGMKFSEDTKNTNSGNYVLGQMLKNRVITSDQKDTLLFLYNKFEEEQNDYLNNYTLSKDKQIENTLKLKIQIDGQQYRKIHQLKSGTIDQLKRVSLLAKIFSLWSIISSQSDNDEGNEDRIVFYRAHAAQIICAITVLGLDNHNVTNQVITCNRLAEVKTGQGKSIVLAVLSIYFALFGYEVHCACYSQMLSLRDSQEFEKLFDLCKVKPNIHYGIFQKIIKKVLNQKNQQNHKQQLFENVIKQMITQSVPSSVVLDWLSKKMPFIKKFVNFFSHIGFSGQKKAKKVLIIDQIDVLFDKNYYGDTFNQSIDIRDTKIVELFQFIWKNKANITPKMIQQSIEFKEIIKKYQSLSKILKNQVQGMLAALSTYKDQTYTILDQKIMYKVQDSLMDVSYSYNTVFAYMQQFQKRKVSQSAYNDHLVINLCVAQFSYACLPQYYNNVLGVTGTLTCLPLYIKNHLNFNYKIMPNQMFPIPSVYGAKTENRKILKNICVKKQGYYQQLIKSVSEQFNNKRPVLVFFRNKSELMDFFSSSQFRQYQQFTSFVIEQHTQFQRNQRIKNSSNKDTITLLTSSFIRGTDFKLFNKKASQSGGFHGIVAYLIDNTADYIQATGRVARQGKKGTFIEIFDNNQLQVLGIQRNDPSAMYKIAIERVNKQQKQKQSCEQKLKAARKRHDQTIKVFQDKDFNQEKLIGYVANKNKFPETFEAKKARMVLLVDATTSMAQLFAQLRSFLPQIFDDVYETLAQKKFPGCLEMQIILYRNYNSQMKQLLEYSTFQNQGENLKRYIGQSRVSGGWGNQAVQVALQYVNTLQNIDEIILIGDARGNTDQEVQYKRNTYKNLQQQRIQKGYTATTTQNELNDLIRKNIKISSFYLNNSIEIKKYFEQLSRSSYGVSQYINIYNKTASTTMTTFIVERGLALIGGDKHQGDALIAEYKKLLSKRMGR